MSALLELAERDTLPFELGKTHQTQEGKSVTIIAVSDQRGYECVQGDDPSENSPTGVWRYNRAYPTLSRCSHDPL